MDHQLENKEQMDNEILVDNMNQLTEFIKSTEEATINYKTYNEKLYTTHSQWLDYVKIQILEALKNSDSNINFSDINYDKSLLSLLNNIKKPHNYRNKKDNNITSNNSINQSIYKEEIFEKIDKLTNFNDIIDSLNSCSKYKRNSLLSKIHNDDDNNNNNSQNEINNNNPDCEEKFEIEYNNINDGDININLDEFESNNKKTKIDNNFPYFGTNEKMDENSLCTIEEQPSMEDKEKSNMPSSSFNFFNSKKYSFSNKINSQNSDNHNNVNQDKYILELNNNMINNNNEIFKFSPNTDNKLNYNPIKKIEPINTIEKYNNYSSSQTINLNNNNNCLLSNTKNENNNLIISDKKSPCFCKIKDSDNNIKIENSQKNGTKFMMPQFSFKKNDEKTNNNNLGFLFSTEEKKNFNYSDTKKIDSNIKNKVITVHTTVKKDQNNNNNNMNFNYISNIKNNEKNNTNIKSSNNFINVLTNSINNVNNQSIKNTDSKNNNNTNITLNNMNKFESQQKPNKYVQKVVLTSLKKMKELNHNMNNHNIIKKEKYEDDFEEYEISDSSLRDDDDEFNDNKFIPKWAKDEEYINQQVIKQINDKDSVMKSFGNCVVEHLNLNMIFETHNELYDIRHSTADWRGDDSLSINKVSSINDNEMDAMFPNRKLEF